MRLERWQGSSPASPWRHSFLPQHASLLHSIVCAHTSSWSGRGLHAGRGCTWAPLISPRHQWLLVPSGFGSWTLHFGKFCELVNAHGWFKIGHDDNIYTMEIGECYINQGSYFSSQWACVYPAHPCQLTQGWAEERRAGGSSGEKPELRTGRRTPAVCHQASNLASLSSVALSVRWKFWDRFERMATRYVSHEASSVKGR